MNPRDVRQAEANARGDRLAGALDRTAGLSTAAAEAKGRRQLPGDEVELRTRACHASLVVAALGVVQLAVQIRQPLSVVRPCPAVEDGVSGDASGDPEPQRNELRGGGAARVGRRTGGGGDQIRDVDLLARIGEQDRDVAEALAVPQARDLTGVGDGPEVSLVAKDRLAVSRLLRLDGRRGVETEMAHLRHEPVHPELPRGAERAREESRRLAAPRAGIAREEQARMRELGPCEEGSRAHALVHRRGVLVVANRVGDAAERRGQQAEVVGDGPRAREPRGRDPDPTGVGHQKVVQLRRTRAVVQLRGDGGEKAHRDHPGPVVGQRKALLRQRGKLELCFGLAVHLAPPECTEAAYEHRGGCVGAGLRPSEVLVETTLVIVEDERLNLVTHDRLRVVLPPTELDRALRLLLAVGEAAVHDRARRPPHRQVRQVEGLAQLARDLRPRLDLAVGRHHVAELEESNDAKPVPQKRELAVARPLSEANDLIGDREALLRRLWPPERDEPSTERGGELPRVSELPGERELLLAQGEDPRRLRVPVEVDRQAREEPRPEPRVAVPEAVERFLEELDAGLVDDPAPHPEQTRALPGEAERAAGQERRVSDPSRDVGGLSERLTCRGAIAGFPLRAATRE